MMTDARPSKTFQWLIALRMPLILLALVVTVTLLTDGRFARLDNIINVMRQVSFEALIAFGMTLVIALCDTSRFRLSKTPITRPSHITPMRSPMAVPPW